jgi:predicted dehydrogenase
MHRNGGMNRREFVKGAAAAMVGAPFIVRASALGLEDKTAASERVALGCIGVGGRGVHNMLNLVKYGGQIVAICDVKADVREQVSQRFNVPASACYNDFRELLERKDVDAVMIATPDHWHVLIGIAAIKAGKDVYLEKPLGITIEEGKAMRKAVQESDRVFMHGTEQRGMPDVRKVCELVRNGRIGYLRRMVVACPGGEEIPAQPEMPVPKGFDYNMWLGPAKQAPYNGMRCKSPFHFFISDYASSGYVCGWGVHHLDVAQWANDSDHTGPTHIQGIATFPKQGSLSDTPLIWIIEYRYANGVEIRFTDASQNPEGIRFEGTEGWIFKAYGQPAKAHPPSVLESEIGPDEIHLYETDSDDHCFLECVKSRKETCSPIEVAHRSTTVGYLGHIAVLRRRELRWFPEIERFVNDPQADELLSRPMRPPWRL